MRKIIRRINRHMPSIIIGLFSAGVYLCNSFIFFAMMAIENWPLRHASRTLATTLFTWVVMTCVMHSVYGGFDVGRKKNKPVISGMCLAVLVTDLLTYLQLQIMNVNVYNNTYLELFGRDFFLLLLSMIMQIMCIILFVHVGNNTYFKMHPPRECVLILGSQENRKDALMKLNRYKLQYHVNEIALADEQGLEKRIARNSLVVLSGIPSSRQMEILRLCYRMQKDVMCRAELEDIMLSSARQVVVDDAPFLMMESHKMTLSQRIIKRVSDIAISLPVLFVFSPLLAVVSLLIKMEDHGPVIYKQKRMTVNGRVFTISKFRTMSVKASEMQHQISAGQDDARITRIGRILRKYRIDELPQFFNILMGDMTIVGPRPEMLQNIAKYKLELPEFAYREKMKAGLTGFAQIEGRYNTTPEDKLMLDLMYIESFSIWLDIKLIFRTLTVFFKADSTQGFENKEDADQ